MTKDATGHGPEPAEPDYIAEDWRLDESASSDFYMDPETVQEMVPGRRGWWVRISGPRRDDGDQLPALEHNGAWRMRAYREGSPLAVEWMGSPGQPERGMRIFIAGLDHLRRDQLQREILERLLGEAAEGMLVLAQMPRGIGGRPSGHSWSKERFCREMPLAWRTVYARTERRPAQWEVATEMDDEWRTSLKGGIPLGTFERLFRRYYPSQRWDTLSF